MNTKIFMTFCLLLAIVLGVSINNIALSNEAVTSTSGIKIATVDITELLVNSESVKVLKSTHDEQVGEIEKTLEKARQEISKETDPAKIAQLEEKYRNEVNNKKLKMDKTYNDKLMAIDKGIKIQVAQKAKEMNYDVVLPKNLVLYGGEDITAQLAKTIK